MEKRSRRSIRDLVALPASQGLSENETGCARISIVAKSTNALMTGRIQKRKTNPSITSIWLATHGQSILKFPDCDICSAACSNNRLFDFSRS